MFGAVDPFASLHLAGRRSDGDGMRSPREVSRLDDSSDENTILGEAGLVALYLLGCPMERSRTRGICEDPLPEPVPAHGGLFVLHHVIAVFVDAARRPGWPACSVPSYSSHDPPAILSRQDR